MFIPLECIDTNPHETIWVNPAFVVSVEPADEANACFVYLLDHEDPVMVTGDPSVVIKLLS